MATASGNAPRHGAHFSDDKGGGTRAAFGSGRSRRPKDRRDERGRKATYMASPRVSSHTAEATQRAAVHAGHNRRAYGKGSQVRVRERRFVGVFVAILLVGALVGGGIYGWRRLSGEDEGASVESGVEVSVTVPEGAGGSQIAQLLLDAGVIGNTADFFKEVQSQDADALMKSGTYRFVTGGNVKEIVHQLVLGSNSTEGMVTIAEGLTVARTAAVVADATDISADDFVAQAKASNYVADYPFLADAADDSLEGFLFPKTYDLSGKDVTADAVIRLMLDQFAIEVASLDTSSAAARLKADYGVDVGAYDLLKLASIIEREAITEEDRTLVSSVLYNRLRDGMYLQSDATMGYVTGGEVTADDLKTDSPYNTYLYGGLTPTPICNPGLASIQAAMDPASSNYYYFLIIENGDYSNHTFSETYEQHQQAIAVAQSEQG